MADHSIAEEWRPIPGFDGCYEASSFGRVRVSGSVEALPEFNLGGCAAGAYRGVQVMSRSCYVHRLVASAFVVRERQEQKYVNHIDGNPANNAPKNLEWVTMSENIKHAVRTGLLTMPQDRPGTVFPGRRKLTESQVADIRAMSKNGASNKEIAAKFGTHPGNVRSIVSRRTWKHVH